MDKKRFRLIIIIMMMMGITFGVFTNDAHAEYEYGSLYALEIAPIGDKFHYKYGETIEFRVLFTTDASCDQMGEFPALRLIQTNGDTDNLIAAVWHYGADGRFSSGDTHYFETVIGSDLPEGEYHLLDLEPSHCETPEGDRYYSWGHSEFLNLLANNIVIDNTPPTITSAKITTDTTHKIVYNVGDSITFEVTFNEAISGNLNDLSLELNNGGYAYFTGKPESNRLQFTYVVQADQDIDQLDTVRLVGPLKDLAGNETSSGDKQVSVTNNPGIIIDTTAPEISVTPTSATNYARSHAITLTISDRDDETSIYHLWNQSSATPGSSAINGVGAASGQELPQPGAVNGDYYVHIRAVDDVGNEAIKTFGPYRFDHQPPTVTFSEEPKTSNEPITITLTASDALSGLQEFTYRWLGESDPIVVTESTVDVTTPNADGSYTLEVTVTDNVGNTETYTKGPYTIDITPPNVQFSRESDSTPAPSHTVDLTVTDSTSAGAKVYAQWSENAVYPGDDGEHWQLIHEGNFPLEQAVQTPPDADGSLYLHVQAIDGMGNIARKSTTGSFVLDNTPPSVVFLPDGNNGIYTSSVDVQLQIDGAANGFSDYEIFYVISSDSTVDEASADWLPTVDGSIFITDRTGIYYIHAKVTDAAGNQTIASSEPFAVDHQPPAGSASFTKAYTNDTEILVELWAEDNVAGPMLDVSYSLNGGPWSSWSSYTDHLSVHLDYDLQGTQQIAVKYRDSAGNESPVYTAETVYDRTAPTVSEVIFNPPATVWTNQSVEVTVHYTDNLSPDGSLTESFAVNGTYTVEFYDLAGNKGVYVVEITNIDLEAPNITFATNGSGSPRQAVSTKVNVTDNASSGSALQVRYGWSPSPVAEPSEWTDLHDLDQEIHLNEVDGNWYLWVKARDEAGNGQTATSNSFLLDNTPPSATITYDPATRTANEVTARITFNEEATILSPADGSDVYIFTDNGEFTFEFVDVAGNKATATAIVDWIDHSMPSAQVIRTPDSWTNGNVEVTLSVDGEPPRGLLHIVGPAGSELVRVRTKEFGELTAWPEEEATVTEVVYLLTENGELTYTIVDLETGLENTGEKVTVDYIDRVAPTAYLLYSHTTWTNQDVIVELVAADDRTNVIVIGDSTHRFTTNGSHTFQFRDAAGNYAEITAVVDWIDKEAPNPVVTFDRSTWTTEAVTANITFDNETEPVRILNHDGRTTFTFEENGQVTVQYEDIAGNAGQTTIVVDWIDREAPTGYLTYSTTDWTNQDVAVTLHVQDNSGAPVIFEVEGNEGGNRHTFTENGEFTFIVSDQAGNTSSFTAAVQRIDRTPPQAEVIYSTTAPTNSLVQVTISPDEQVTVLNNNGRTFYNFIDNGSFTFIIADRAGNITHVETKVDWIDRDPPIPQITYSTTEPTNQPVIASITANEEFYVQNNNRSKQYVFTENGSFTFYIQDVAGNTAEITAVVNNIDATPPDIKLIYSEEKPTTADVTVEVVSDRPLTILNNGGSPIVTFKQNGIFRLEAMDSFGQIHVIPIEVDYIDRIKPEIRFLQGSQILIKQGEAVQPLLDVEAFDNLDGDITDKIVILHNIDSSKPGEYTVTYRVQDRAGNLTEVTRKAQVLAVDRLTVFVNGEIPSDEGLTLRASEISLQILAARGDVIVRWSEGKKYLGDFKMNTAQLTDDTLQIDRQNYYTFLIEDQERQYELIHVYVIPIH